MKRLVPPDSERREGSAFDGEPLAETFRGFLRVREATADERKEFTHFFRECDFVGRVERAPQSDRFWVPVVERCENGKWIPIGGAVVNDIGHMTFHRFAPHQEEQGFSPSAIRAVIQYLREYPLAALSACVDSGDSMMADAYCRAGFVFSGRVSDRNLDSYRLTLREECPPFNVWI